MLVRGSFANEESDQGKKFVFDAALNEAPIINREPLVPTLTGGGYYVERVKSLGRRGLASSFLWRGASVMGHARQQAGASFALIMVNLDDYRQKLGKLRLDAPFLLLALPYSGRRVIC